ncbi:glycosyltransferase family 4 protein [Paeniglutamicibacter psychrophenolicus]|uniref:glycosyltransferase family 4 protein n=1 Tax=Paeniglutamicibacter psychrophenolicus TaxID=257454 RepID=UPI00278A871E|nr:glycosyltransferase family 4 protein [Paeniglutamicibacter psychrophenolicus]MDQ0096130.1 glycosyltransferase involved in cell wall biosynthesis [Paeniglutamicibacter psychrophenolicus]
MRIGIIAPPWLTVPPQAYGGTEAVIDSLARGLAGLGHQVLLAAAAGSSCPVEPLPGAHPPDPAHMGRGQDELRHVLAAYAAMESMDVIHDHTLAGPLLRLAGPGIPVISTAHNRFDAGTLPVYRAIGRCASLLAISTHQKSEARGVEVGGVIHHGIEAAAVPLGAGAGGYACFLGRMHPDKGVLTAIRIARRAGVPLKIAAKMHSAGELAYFRDVVGPELGGHIEYVGEVGPQEKFRLLGDAFALLNPIQWSEPFGMVMIEAMATGTPVVSTPRGAAPEIVADGVTGFIRDTPKSLAAALARCPELRRADCRAATETQFGARRMVDEHVAFYARRLSSKAGADVVPV